jgi:hypothetical protein
VTFRLERASIDPEGVLSAIRLKGKADLIAAAVLERLSGPLRNNGFPFANSETGYGGAYASTGYRTESLVVSVLLIRLKCASAECDDYELHLSVLRRYSGRRHLFPRGQVVCPSAEELGQWEMLRSTLDEALRKRVNAENVIWYR